MPIMEYATQREVDVKVKRLEETADYKDRLTTERINTLEKVLDERFSRLEAVIERNAARQEGMLQEMRGELKALNTRLDVSEKRIDDLHQTQNRWFMLFGVLIAAVPVAIAIVQAILK